MRFFCFFPPSFGLRYYTHYRERTLYTFSFFFYCLITECFFFLSFFFHRGILVFFFVSMLLLLPSRE